MTAAAGTTMINQEVKVAIVRSILLIPNAYAMNLNAFVPASLPAKYGVLLFSRLPAR